jgi:hypothetical protein
MKKRVSGIIALFLSLLVLAGCTSLSGGSVAGVQQPGLNVTSPPASTPTVPDNIANGSALTGTEYVAVYTNLAIFINWTETNNNLTGQLQQGTIDINTLAMTSENFSFTGVLNGGNISILLSNGATMTGTLSKNILTLLYPTSDGTMQTIVFKPGSVTDFNAAIGNFQNQKNAKDASDTLSSSLAKINQDASQAARVSFDDDMNSFGSLLKGMQSYYQFLKSYVSEQPLTSGRLDAVSEQLNVVSVRLDNIKNFLDVNSSAFGVSFGYHVQQAQALYTQLGNDITKLQQNWKIYQSLNVSADAVLTMESSSAIGNAQKQQAALSQRIATAQEQGNSYYSQGEKIYQTASKYVSGLTASGSN